MFCSYYNEAASVARMKMPVWGMGEMLGFKRNNTMCVKLNNSIVITFTYKMQKLCKNLSQHT